MKRRETAAALIQKTFGDGVRRIGLEPEDEHRDWLFRQFRLGITLLSWLGLGLMIICQLLLPDLETAPVDALWGVGLAMQILVALTSFLTIVCIIRCLCCIPHATSTRWRLPEDRHQLLAVG